jgi:hypothetical protein
VEGGKRFGVSFGRVPGLHGAAAQCRWVLNGCLGWGYQVVPACQRSAAEPGRWGNIKIVKIAPLTVEGRWGNGHRGSSLCCCAVCATGRELKKKKRTRLPELPDFQPIAKPESFGHLFPPNNSGPEPVKSIPNTPERPPFHSKMTVRLSAHYE